MIGVGRQDFEFLADSGFDSLAMHEFCNGVFTAVIAFFSAIIGAFAGCRNRPVYAWRAPA